jgi:uncharacterized protein (UPF0332 family)
VGEAAQRLRAAHVLLQDEQWDDAVGRAYCAMFLAAKALLQSKGSEPRTQKPRDKVADADRFVAEAAKLLGR